MPNPRRATSAATWLVRAAQSILGRLGVITITVGEPPPSPQEKKITKVAMTGSKLNRFIVMLQKGLIQMQNSQNLSLFALVWAMKRIHGLIRSIHIRRMGDGYRI